MTSARKIEANRANGRKSGGPSTAQGKARASKNARRHGLTLPVTADPVLSKEIEAVAQEIAGETTDQDILREARAFAEAHIDLLRIRRARTNVLSRHMICVETSPNGACEETVTAASGPRFPAELASISTLSSEVLDQLIKIDRYERRTLSKRKFAIRRLDAACRK